MGRTDIPADWPHRQASRRLTSDGLEWHVQVFEADTAGSGGSAGSTATSATAPAKPPSWLLLHGTGASAHSWRGVAPRLARGRRIIVPDLPGHAFTARPGPDGLTLPGMARLLGGLMRTLGEVPEVVVGHSAGAAIGARMALDGPIPVRHLVGLNGAWLPPSSQGRWFYEPLARLLVLNPVVPHLFAWHAGHRVVLERLLASTGSVIDAPGRAFYARLVADPGHVGAVLAMMASWDLSPLLADLHRLPAVLDLVVATGDLTVPPSTSDVAAQRVVGARLHRLDGLGHLAQEEDPAQVAVLLERLAGGGAA